MKAFLIVTIFVLSLGQKALACEPPPDATYVQPSEYAAVVESVDVLNTLRKKGGEDIKSITHKSGEYTVNSTNGCWVRAKVVYDQPSSVGQCPQVKGVEVLGSKCIFH